MSDPQRWSRDKGAPSEVRELLRRAHRSRPLPPDVRARSAARIDRLAVLPVTVGALAWLKGVAVAAGIVGALAVARELPRLVEASRPPESARKASTAAPLSRASTEAVPSPLAVGPRPLASPSAPSGVAALAPASLAPFSPPGGENARARLSAARTNDIGRDPSPPDVSSASPARTLASPAASLAGDPSALAASPSSPSQLPGGRESALAREAALLEQARASLAQDPGATLARLGECAAEFPHGALRVERELIAVDALRRLGRFDAARARGEALRVDARGSIYEARVRSLLATLPAPP